jgi:hypothetical protein
VTAADADAPTFDTLTLAHLAQLGEVLGGGYFLVRLPGATVVEVDHPTGRIVGVAWPELGHVVALVEPGVALEARLVDGDEVDVRLWSRLGGTVELEDFTRRPLADLPWLSDVLEPWGDDADDVV